MALKDLWLNLKGTLNAVLQIGGKLGVILKNNSGALLVRNAADSAAADVTAAVVTALTSWKLTIGGFTVTLNHSITADRAITFQDKAGAIALVGDGISRMACRLSLSSTDPCPLPGSTPSNTVYLHPFEGDNVLCYDDKISDFQDRAIGSPLSHAMIWAGAGTIASLWAYYTNYAVTPQLKVVDDFEFGASSIQFTAITNATPPVFTSAEHGLVTNNILVLSINTPTNINATPFRVTVLSSSTFSIQTLAGVNVTAPGVASQSPPASGLYGVGLKYSAPTSSIMSSVTYVKGIPTRTFSDGGHTYTATFLGLARGAPDGLIHDNYTELFLYNQWCQVWRPVLFRGANETFPHATITNRPHNNNLAARVEYIAPFANKTPFRLKVRCFPYYVGATAYIHLFWGLGLDQWTNLNGEPGVEMVFDATRGAKCDAFYEEIPSVGYHWLQWANRVNSDTGGDFVVYSSGTNSYDGGIVGATLR